MSSLVPRDNLRANSLPKILALWQALVYGCVFMLAGTVVAAAQSPHKDFIGTSFPPVQQWVNAFNAFDQLPFRNLYSRTPPAQFVTQDKQYHDISEELMFWQQAKAGGGRDLEATIVDSGEQQGMKLVTCQVSLRMNTPAGPRTRYVLEDQAWQQQSEGWRIVLARHTDFLKMPQPTHMDPHLYKPGVNAKAEIKEAVAQATAQHKRIILMFGANWCYDCHVLDFVLHHQAELAKLMDRGFILVHVDIGEGKLNPDLVEQYKIPIKRGVPALAVLDSDGKLLYSANGEFEKARSMDPDDLIAFLNKWKRD